MTPQIASIPFPPINPVIFRLGPLALRWYGLAYLLGFAFAYLLLKKLARQGALRISLDALGDMIGWLVLGVLVGGRVGWWLFYHHNIPGPYPWYEPLAAWHGGMSFHGGLIGVITVLIVWCRRHKAPFWNIADCAALVTPIGLFFGRIANFINAELFGRPTTLPWGVIFPGDIVARHPSQLYEAILEGPLLMLCLWTVKRRGHPADGQLAALFLIFYGCFRFAVEFTREPDSQLGFIAFGWLTMGQLLSIFTAVAGVALWMWRRPKAAA